jgi:predicted Zn-dependent peptidase
MDPVKLARLAELARTGITPAERRRADELFLASMIASEDYQERQVEVWGILVTRQWPSPPTWQQLFDDLTPERAARLGERYDALPDGARIEYDKRYGRPQDV